MKCRTKRCRGSADPKRNHSPYCHNCAKRRFKEKYPLKYYFNALRTRAKQRKKEFTLTYAQYEHFAKYTGYEKLKGKTSLSLSINRKNNKEGYHWWNIEAITLSMNSRLMFTDMPDYLKQEMLEAERLLNA